MNFPRLIVVSGKARAGKGSIASILVQHFGYTELSFAGTLKMMAKKYYGVTDTELTLVKTPTSRQIMQGIGNMMRGEVDPLYWVKRVDAEWRATNTPVVVSDGRFINEFKWCKENNGLLWKVVRADQPAVEFGATDPSEVEQDRWSEWDAILYNPSSDIWHQHLSNQVRDLLGGGADG